MLSKQQSSALALPPTPQALQNVVVLYFLPPTPRVMNINVAVLGLLLLTLGLHTVYALSEGRSKSEETRHLPWVPIQVGKSKTYVHKTQDAGMFIEATRRRAIRGGNAYGRDIEPNRNFWQRGSTNGTLETFFLSATCPTLTSVFPPPDLIYDGGRAEVAPGLPVYDGGDAGTGEGDGTVLNFGGALYVPGTGQVQQNVCAV